MKKVCSAKVIEQKTKMMGRATVETRTYADGKVKGQSDGAKIGGREWKAWRGEEVFGVGERAHENGP